MENKEIIQELEQVAPLLNKIGKKPVQTVPAGYFDHFQVQIPQDSSTIQSAGARVVKMDTRRNGTLLQQQP